MVNRFKYFDWPMLAAIILLSFVGLLMIYSTGDMGLLLRQVAALGLGLLGLFFLSTLDYHFFQKNSTVLYVLGVVLLLGVLVFGQQIRGSVRWFNLGFFNFQPAEFSKLAFLILMAKIFQVRKPLLQRFRFVLISFLYVLVPVVLIMLEPDLGSAVVHIVIWLGLLLVSAMPRRYFFYLLVIFLIVAAVGWQFVLKDYQKDRVRSFVSPTSDPLGRGYNVTQSMVAVGSGGVLGRGLARGLQSQLKFLPERQTDFIFASTVEELGLVGGALVLVLFCFLLWRMVKVFRGARDSFGMFLGAGVFFMIFTQAVVNIGMNMGLLPVTGITLPFLSYGGSSLVIVLWLMGIMQNIARNSVPVKFG